MEVIQEREINQKVNFIKLFSKNFKNILSQSLTYVSRMSNLMDSLF